MRREGDAGLGRSSSCHPLSRIKAYLWREEVASALLIGGIDSLCPAHTTEVSMSWSGRALCRAGNSETGIWDRGRPEVGAEGLGAG